MRQVRKSAMLGFLFALFILPSLHSQAMPGAYKTLDMSAFGGYISSSPDFGNSQNSGGGFGVNVTRYLRGPVAPSIEARFNQTSGPQITERSFLVGFRAQADVRRIFHPYADVIGGIGQTTYAHSPNPFDTHDQGTVLSYGAGIDIDLVHHLQAKFDFQFQSWNLGVNGDFKPQGGDFTLSPTLLLIGLAYRIPFHEHYGEYDYHHRSNPPPPPSAPLPTPQPPPPPPSQNPPPAAPEGTSTPPSVTLL